MPFEIAILYPELPLNGSGLRAPRWAGLTIPDAVIPEQLLVARNQVQTEPAPEMPLEVAILYPEDPREGSELDTIFEIPCWVGLTFPGPVIRPPLW